MTGERTRILVTGATGMVGRLVLDRLAERLSGTHTQVVGLTRRAARARETRSDVAWVEGDLEHAGSLGGIAEGCDSVLHVAGGMPADAEACFRINRDGTRALLDEAIASGVRRFVFVSSVAVYGDRQLVGVTESTRRAAESPYARAKLDAEDLVLGAAARGDVEGVVIRPCPILGAGSGHFAAGVRALVGQPTVPLPDGGEQLVDLVDAWDVACAVVTASLRHELDPPAAFHLAAGDAMTMREILEAAAEVCGKAPRFEALSLEEALAINARAVEASAAPPIPPALVAYAMFERTYDSTRARGQLEFRPTPPREALCRAIAANA